MHVTKESMTMTYSVDITGQKVFLEGFYEVIKKNTDKVIFRIKVEELEFGNREDGRNFCRVWGSIDNTEIQSYLFALDCLPIEQSMKGYQSTQKIIHWLMALLIMLGFEHCAKVWR